MEFLHLLETIRTPLLNSIVSAITLLGEETVMIAILCLIYWCIDKKTAMKTALTYFFSGLLIHGLKVTFRIERPWVRDNTLTPVGVAIEGTGGSYSFPSGHTQSATALFSPLAFSYKKAWFKVLCFVLIVLVGFSRLYLGVHTPEDVLVAFAATIIISILVSLFFEKLEKNYMLTGIILSLFGIALCIYVIILFTKGIINEKVTESICKAIGAGLGFALGWIIEHKFIDFSPECNKPWHQAVKYIIGIGLTVGIKSGLKPIIGDSLVADTVRYMLVVLFAIALYPLIFKKILAKK